MPRRRTDSIEVFPQIPQLEAAQKKSLQAFQPEEDSRLDVDLDNVPALGPFTISGIIDCGDLLSSLNESFRK